MQLARRAAVFLTALLLLASNASANQKLVPGIASLGGIALQDALEDAFSADHEQGPKEPMQELLSENDKFWAGVEPKPRRALRQERPRTPAAAQETAAGSYGPRLLDSRIARRLLSV